MLPQPPPKREGEESKRPFARRIPEPSQPLSGEHRGGYGSRDIYPRHPVPQSPPTTQGEDHTPRNVPGSVMDHLPNHLRDLDKQEPDLSEYPVHQSPRSRPSNSVTSHSETQNLDNYIKGALITVGFLLFLFLLLGLIYFLAR